MKQFTINKNKHYCRWFWTKFFCPHWNHKSWTVTFKIAKENYLSAPRNPDDYDISKLYGCGFGFNHHANSWRLGWNWDFEQANTFNLYAYVYDETGQHISEHLGKVKGGKNYTVVVESKDKKYWFSCLDLGVLSCLPNTHKDCKLEFDLYPYNGGNNTAPHKETFFIDYNPQ